MKYDLRELEDLALETLASYENPDEDIIAEIANNLVPVYNYDLIQYAANDLHLALVEPEAGPAFDGAPTPINIIAANIYEHLVGFLTEAVADRDNT